MAVNAGDDTTLLTLFSSMGFVGELYSPGTATHTISFSTSSSFAGENVWAKARVRTWSVSGMVINTSRIAIYNPGTLHPDNQATPDQTPRHLTLSPRAADTSKWDGATYTPFNIRIQKGRWCYWIIDFISVKYPNASTFYA